MNRGSKGKKITWPGQATRFNEAPIHESGKYSKTLQARKKKVALQ